jgi:transcriptional regulator with XRE-family HTH domain
MSAEEKFIKALGKNIDKYRQAKGLSFQEMALACEMEKSQAYRLCKEGINITSATLFKISKGLDVSVSELFNFKY